MSLVSETAAAADEGRNSQRAFNLPGVLFVAGTEAFLTALILFSGEPSPAWLFYLIPMTIGALAYGVAGSVATWAISAGMFVLVAPVQILRSDWPMFLTGFCVFLAGGLVTGVQAHRLRVHAAELESGSPLDPLTGVYRPEQFAVRLSAEIARADRYGHSTGLAIVRVVGFEDFTRVFGRYKADAMLEHLADVLRLSVRSTDTIGRLDATDFALVLPHARPDEAAAVAERITGVVAETGFDGDALEPVTACETVAASAAYPADAADYGALLDAARRRLPSADPDPDDTAFRTDAS
ncbi:MAG: Diguanylate cyclase [Actinobacteria bacterium 66_15]|nr:MAG: Diguanylate cyclase [Actinobacteria bacterium 66_15]